MKPIRLFILGFIVLFSLFLVFMIVSSARSTGVLAATAFTPGPVERDEDAIPADEDPWVVRAYFDDPAMAAAVAAVMEPWEVHYQQGYLVVSVDRTGYQWLLDQGFRVYIDSTLTAEINRPQSALPSQTSGIPGYPCYRTVEETYQAAVELTADYPNLATWIDIGDTWEKITPGGDPGYDLMVLRLTNNEMPGPKPSLFLMSSLHAREYTPAEMNMRFAEYLLENYNHDPDATWILDHHEIHLLLQANPDGRKKAESGLYWRKNTNNNYCTDTNNRGADLNRNFEFQWGCCGGSSVDPCSEIFRGPAPASEPETQAIQNYVRSIFPDQRLNALDEPVPADATGVFLDLHSYGKLVMWPWSFTTLAPPNEITLQTLGRKLAFFNGYSPQQAIYLYPADGVTDDFAYGDLGLAAYTLELGTRFFQSCDSFEEEVFPENLPAMVYAARVARAPYQLPSGPDVVEINASPVANLADESVRFTIEIDDTRFNNVNGIEQSQVISAAELYLDTPPWQVDSMLQAYPLQAEDGAFDQPIEIVTGTINTIHLSPGRHIVYVRGQDATGNWGPVSAQFIEGPYPPMANFTFRDPATVGWPVQFSNISTGTLPLTYTWDFGDGSSISTLREPIHIFTSTGTFTVTLTVSNPIGVDSAAQSIHVLPYTPIQSVNLQLLQDGPFLVDELVEFQADLIPVEASMPFTYTINYGDASGWITGTSHLHPLYLVHAYTTNGAFTTTLSARNRDMSAPVSATVILDITHRELIELHMPIISRNP